MSRNFEGNVVTLVSLVNIRVKEYLLVRKQSEKETGHCNDDFQILLPDWSILFVSFHSDSTVHNVSVRLKADEKNKYKCYSD